MKTYRIRKPRIVVIGGGTGLPVILHGLRNQSADITAIVTVADDGGSSGILRENMRMSPPGDIRNVLVALSDMPRIYEDIFQYRFKNTDDGLRNHTIGNLIIAALSEMQGSTYDAVQLLSKIMHVDGHVYPASEKDMTLHAKLKDGSLVTGESQIAKHNKPIDSVYVTDTETGNPVKPSRKVVKSILEADMVVLGPGSLYTSILPNLMIEEIADAIKKTSAEVVYICNIMTQKGETENFSDADHVKTIHKHLGTKVIDTVLVNTEQIPESFLKEFKHDEYLIPVKHDFQGLRDENCRVISTSFIEIEGCGVYHDEEKVSDELFRVLFGVKN